MLSQSAVGPHTDHKQLGISGSQLFWTQQVGGFTWKALHQAAANHVSGLHGIVEGYNPRVTCTTVCM